MVLTRRQRQALESQPLQSQSLQTQSLQSQPLQEEETADPPSEPPSEPSSDPSPVKPKPVTKVESVQRALADTPGYAHEMFRRRGPVRVYRAMHVGSSRPVYSTWDPGPVRQLVSREQSERCKGQGKSVDVFLYFAEDWVKGYRVPIPDHWHIEGCEVVEVCRPSGTRTNEPIIVHYTPSLMPVST